MRLLIGLILMFWVQAVCAQKPRVWIISDGSDKTIMHPQTGKRIGDPDDLSALAGYLLMCNHFDTRAITVASTQDFVDNGVEVPNQKEWAETLFGKAFKKDL